MSSNVLDKLRMWPWLFLALVSTCIIAFVVPYQIGVLVWSHSNLSLGAYLGYWVDRSVFHYCRPPCFATAGVCSQHDSPCIDYCRRNFGLGAGRMSWAWFVSGLLLIAAGIFVCASAFAQLPASAGHYRRDLTRIAQQEMGLAAPVALFAAQIHQESSWRSGAKSTYAERLTQLTPATAKWISEIYPDLRTAAPYSPSWAMRAMVRYDLHILARVNSWRGQDIPECEHLAFTLSGYNGVPGWISRDRRQVEAAAHC